MKKDQKENKFGLEVSLVPINLYENLKDRYELEICPIFEECSLSRRFEILTIDLELKSKEDPKAKELYLKELAFDLEEVLFNFELYKSVKRSPYLLPVERRDCSNCEDEYKIRCDLAKPFEFLNLAKKKIVLELKRIDLIKHLARQGKIKRVLYDLLKFRTEVLKIDPDISETKFLQYASKEDGIKMPDNVKDIFKNNNFSFPKSRSDIKDNYLVGLNALTFTEKDILKILKELDIYTKKHLTSRNFQPE